MPQKRWDHLVVATRVEYVKSNGDEKPPWEREAEIEKLSRTVATTGADVIKTWRRADWSEISGNESAALKPPPGNIAPLNVGDAVVLVCNTWDYIHKDPILSGLLATGIFEFFKHLLPPRSVKSGSTDESKIGQQNKKMKAASKQMEIRDSRVDETLAAAAARLPEPANPPPTFDAKIAEQQARAAAGYSYPEDDLVDWGEPAIVEASQRESDTTWVVVLRKRSLKPPVALYVARVVRTANGVIAVAVRREYVTPSPRPASEPDHNKPPGDN
jgi:hypothetical protein